MVDQPFGAHHHARRECFGQKRESARLGYFSCSDSVHRLSSRQKKARVAARGSIISASLQLS
jgi:hypothetical protein